VSGDKHPTLLPGLKRLPSGRHQLSRDAVDASQRQRILVAVLYATTELGYSATTVADIVAMAAVSRSTFYANFADKEACFVAAYEFAMNHVWDEVGEADKALPGVGWRARLRTELTNYLDVLASEPALAKPLHVEVLAAGAVALEHRAEMLGMLAARIAQLNEVARNEQPSLPELPPAAFALYTGGLDELIRDRLRVGTPDDLRELASPVLDATYALFGARGHRPLVPHVERPPQADAPNSDIDQPTAVTEGA